MSTFTNSEDPDEMRICGISSGSTLFTKVKKFFRQTIQYLILRVYRGG